jgi:hypothetical protein
LQNPVVNPGRQSGIFLSEENGVDQKDQQQNSNPFPRRVRHRKFVSTDRTYLAARINLHGTGRTFFFLHQVKIGNFKGV